MDSIPFESGNQHPERTEILGWQGNIFHVETPHGHIAYCVNQHEIVDPDPLPPKTDLCVVETFQDPWPDRADQSLESFSTDSMYRAAYENERVPIAMMTPHIRPAMVRKMQRDFEKLQCGIGVGIGAVTAGQSLKTLKNMWSNQGKDLPATTDDSRHIQGITRRECIAALLGAGLTSWLTLPYAATTIRIAATRVRYGHEATIALSRAASALHPEIQYYFPDDRLFAALMIHKMDWILQQHRYSNIAAIVGLDHGRDFADEKLYDWGYRMQYFQEKKDVLRETVDPRSVVELAFVGGRRNEYGGVVRNTIEQLAVPDLRELMRCFHNDGIVNDRILRELAMR